MRIPCDRCGKITEDSLMQIQEKDGNILYLCPECYVASREESPEEQA